MGSVGGADHVDEPDGRVLVFGLDVELYWIDVRIVSEIVRIDGLTPIPSADHVAGVLDLRGTTVTVIDPSVHLDVDGPALGGAVVVTSLDPPSNRVGNRYGLLVDRLIDVVAPADFDRADNESERDDAEPGPLRLDGEPVRKVDLTDLLGE